MSHTPAYRRPPAQLPSIGRGVRCLPWRGGFCLWLAYSPSTHMAISMSSRRTSTCLPSRIPTLPAMVHKSNSPVKAQKNIGAYKIHILINESRPQNKALNLLIRSKILPNPIRKLIKVFQNLFIPTFIARKSSKNVSRRKKIHQQ